MKAEKKRNLHQFKGQKTARKKEIHTNSKASDMQPY